MKYWEEADRLTEEAIRTGDDAELTKAFKILTALSYFSRIADDSRAIILHDLARLEAFRGNRAAADAYIETAKLVSRSTVEPRLSTHPLPEARAGGVKHVETA